MPLDIENFLMLVYLKLRGRSFNRIYDIKHYKPKLAELFNRNYRLLTYVLIEVCLCVQESDVLLKMP